MLIKTSDAKSIQPFIKKFHFPKPESHKGQNGKVLIIGGSSLFHAASIWAAEISSYFVDMVHYASTKENEEIFLSLKKKFHNGIIVPKAHLFDYIQEDDVVLVGPGMVRGESDEAKAGKELIREMIKKFPQKRFVFDAGALQVMEAEWLKDLKQPAIITPHQVEFKELFGKDLLSLSLEEKSKIVQQTAKEYKCVILLKAIVDIIFDGKQIYVVEGGNQGLTKGGTGDILAGLTTSFYAKNDAVTAAIIASFLLKKTAEVLSLEQGYWYNVSSVIKKVPKIFFQLSK